MNIKTKIAFITAQAPWGPAESFIIEELMEVKRQKINFYVIPRSPITGTFHKQAEDLVNHSIWLPVINWKIIITFVYFLITNSLLWKIIIATLKSSRNFKISLKNLTVLPKAVFLSDIVRKNEITHIHAHWGTTTATMGYIVSRITNIPWSFTLHRWDIKQDNILKEKIRSAEFVRCISEHGKKELLKIVGKQFNKKIIVIHTGVKIPDQCELKEKENISGQFTIIIPAYFYEVKGHVYLIKACSILVKQNIRDFQCIFYGEGRLRSKLESLIKEEGLQNNIKMPGFIPHEELIDMYKRKAVDLVVLPSINTNKGSHEGIPVSLMEAMAHKIAVISTNTGGIPELLSNGAGIIVEEKSPEQLADAVHKILENLELKSKIEENSYKHVRKEFNVTHSVKELLQNIENIVFH